MAEIVNLRRVKKRLARDAAAEEAAENRARHGQTRAQRDKVALRHRAQARTLDGAALPRDGEAGE